MISKIFIGLFLMLSISLISSQECSDVGQVVNGKYCDVDGNFKDLKEEGSCLNGYECVIGLCVEESCQSKFSNLISENTKTIEKIWIFFSGEECDPNIDTGYKCEGRVAFLCGSDHVWEEKGEVAGYCGVTGDAKIISESGGGSGISIHIVSPKNITYSKMQIPLQAIDVKKVARYWRYSLDGGERKDFTPNITITAGLGSNTVEVFASRYNSFFSFARKKVIFNVVEDKNTYCGNGVCGDNEDSNSCPEDCGSSDPVDSYCGDNVCDADESSATCSEDCVPLERKDRMWLFYTLVISLLGGIGGVGFFVVKRVKAIVVSKKM